MTSCCCQGVDEMFGENTAQRDLRRWPRWTGGRYEWMRRVLATELGQRLYRKRSQTVEPLFGDTN